MSDPLFSGREDLLRQRRLARGLPAEPKPLPPARTLLLWGSGIGAAVLTLVLAGWGLVLLQDQQVIGAIERMRGVPGTVQSLESQLRREKTQLNRQSKANAALANGLVAVSSGSALLTQLAQLTPQGVQITEATVAGQTLTLKGRAAEPAAFTRVNALSLLLAAAPLFQPDVRVIKLSREAAPTAAATAGAAARAGAAAPTAVGWELSAGLAQLSPAQQLVQLRRLGADGMAERLQELIRAGALP